MDVLVVVGAGRIGLGEGEVESSGGVGQIGGLAQEGTTYR